jgi:WD40 repeat protein
MLRHRVLCLLLVALWAAPAAAAPPPPGARARLGTTDLWHGPAVNDLAFAPDGKTFYSLGSADGAVRQWDAATGAEVRAFAGHKGHVTAFALSRDGRLLAAGGHDRTVRLWNTATGEGIATWNRTLAPVSVALAPDGKALAVLPGDEAGTVAVLDASGKEAATFKVGDPYASRRVRFGRFVDDVIDLRPEGTVVFSPDGRFVAAYLSQAATLWDTTARKRVRRYELFSDDPRFGGGPGGGGFISSGAGGYVGLQFSSDSQTLLAAWGEATVQRWEVSSIEPLEPLKADKADDTATCISVAADGGAVAAAGRRGLTVWDGAGKRLHQLTADTIALTAVACSADGKTVVTGDRQGRLRVWDVATGKERLHPGPRPVFRTLAATADGTVTADEQAIIRWDKAGKEARRLKLDAATVSELLLSPDGKTLAVRRTEGAVQLLDAATGEVRATLESKERNLSTLQFSADGRWLAASSDLGGGGPRGRPARGRVSPGDVVILYDARTGKEVKQLAGTPQPGNQFVFLSDGRTLLTAVSGDSLCLWETLTGKPRRTLVSTAFATTPSRDDLLADLLGGPVGRFRGEVEDRKFTLTPQQLAVAPDDRVAAVVQRTTVSLVDLETGKRLARLEGHTGAIACVAYAPDGRLLVTGGHDHTVRLWDAVTGKEIGALAGHRGPVRSAAFTPDGKTLVTAADDQTALVWDLAAAVKAAGQARREAPAPRPLEELWADLAGDDVLKADAAVRELASRPAEALPLLKERLRPAAAADAKQVARWVADLDADDFAVREAAAAELAKLGEQARPALEAALKNQPPQDLKRRVTELLKNLDERTFPAELVRELRALEALEKIGPAAVKFLEALASGAASDPRTQDAKAALERLKGR